MKLELYPRLREQKRSNSRNKIKFYTPEDKLHYVSKHVCFPESYTFLNLTLS